MKQWQIKELSNLTKISVRTLHHYDKIGLLKPCFRQSNGYRLYSEQDLLKLQQIIALKFFGFELSQIKTLLAKQENALENFVMQAKFLQEKANALLEASSILKRITVDCTNKSIPWQQIIQLIEVYNMTQELEHSWVKEIFTPEELKQYATFETELKANKTPEQLAAFEENWANLVKEVESNLSAEPSSEIGLYLGEKVMQWVNNIYGKKYAHLRTKKFEKGFGEGKGLDEVGLTPEMVLWMDKAMDAYWHKRIYSMLAQVGVLDNPKLLQLWEEILDDMYGDDQQPKKALVEVALKDNNISAAAKSWLKNISKI